MIYINNAHLNKLKHRHIGTPLQETISNQSEVKHIYNITVYLTETGNNRSTRKG